jgi:group I intron endonuclease
MEHVIYKLTSPTGKIYIGRTCDFDKRMIEHKHCALTKKMNNSLYKAIRKYGWENFTKEIIGKVNDKENAQLLEEALIRQYDSVKKGYNDTYVGGGGNQFEDMPNKKMEQFKKKMSRITSGKNNGMYGKKQTEATRVKQREKAKGRFSLPWYITRYGSEEGTKLYNERSIRLKSRKMHRASDGTFVGR